MVSAWPIKVVEQISTSSRFPKPQGLEFVASTFYSFILPIPLNALVYTHWCHFLYAHFGSMGSYLIINDNNKARLFIYISIWSSNVAGWRWFAECRRMTSDAADSTASWRLYRRICRRPAGSGLLTGRFRILLTDRFHFIARRFLGIWPHSSI